MIDAVAWLREAARCSPYVVSVQLCAAADEIQAMRAQVAALDRIVADAWEAEIAREMQPARVST